MSDVLHTLHVDLHASAQDRSYPISIGRGFVGERNLLGASGCGQGRCAGY